MTTKKKAPITEAEMVEILDNLKKNPKSMPPAAVETVVAPIEPPVEEDLNPVEEDLIGNDSAKKVLKRLKERYGTKMVLKMLADLLGEQEMASTCQNAKTLFAKSKATILKAMSEVM